MTDIAPHGPFKVSIEFSFTDGEQVAKASFDCPPGEIPTAANVAEAAENVRRQVRDLAGEQFDWQGRHDFVQDLLSERTGSNVKFAIPGPDRFEAEWAETATKDQP